MESSTSVSLSRTIQLQSDMKMLFLLESCEKKGRQIPFYTNPNIISVRMEKKSHKAENVFLGYLAWQSHNRCDI